MVYTNISLYRLVRYSTEPAPWLTTDNRLHVISLNFSENHKFLRNQYLVTAQHSEFVRLIVHWRKSCILSALYEIIDVEDAFREIIQKNTCRCQMSKYIRRSYKLSSRQYVQVQTPTKFSNLNETIHQRHGNACFTWQHSQGSVTTEKHTAEKQTALDRLQERTGSFEDGCFQREKHKVWTRDRRGPLT